MMNLLLIRHALNDWVGKKLAGWLPDVHLNEEGRAQAVALAVRLADVPLAAIYSSPLDRAVETARPLAVSHGLDVQLREGLGEIRFGTWTGRSLEELKEKELWPVIQVYPSGARFPEGESLHEVQARLVAELDAIRDDHPDQTVAVVSHSDPIKLVVAHYLGLPLDLFQRLNISPASVTAFAFTRFGPRLLVMNHVDPLLSFAMGEEQRPEEQEKER
ncbi:MAG: MSMEG_4193 family putative phosphomutase [Anaerolineae bacterium]